MNYQFGVYDVFSRKGGGYKEKKLTYNNQNKDISLNKTMYNNFLFQKI